MENGSRNSSRITWTFKLNKAVMSANDSIQVSVDVTNMGSRDGAEVVQLYIRDLVGSVTRPVKELKGFQKVILKAGESRTITFSITKEELSFYNNELKWVIEPGKFHVFVGTNSRDAKQGEFELK